jgi:hypothetical protein
VHGKNIFEFQVRYYVLEVIVIFQVYINIIYLVFAMLDMNTDARYEYKYANGHKYKYKLIETKK